MCIISITQHLKVAHLDAVFVNRFGKVIDVHLAIKGKGGGALHKPLNLCPAEVLGPLCMAPSVDCLFWVPIV